MYIVSIINNKNRLKQHIVYIEKIEVLNQERNKTTILNFRIINKKVFIICKIKMSIFIDNIRGQSRKTYAIFQNKRCSTYSSSTIQKKITRTNIMSFLKIGVSNNSITKILNFLSLHSGVLP